MANTINSGAVERFKQSLENKRLVLEYMHDKRTLDEIEANGVRLCKFTAV